MKTLKNILLLIPMGIIGATIVYAAAPAGGYDPNATLNPDCAPADTDCFVKKIGKFIDGTNATDAVYVAGNVGIGTNSPSSKLHVEGTSGTINDGLIVQSATGGNEFGFYSSLNDFHLRSVTGGVDILTADFSGNVGIGTTPSAKLHVDGGNSVFTGGNVGIGTISPSSKLSVIGTELNKNVVNIQKPNEAYALTNSGTSYFPVGTIMTLESLDTGIDNSAALINFSNRNSNGYTSAFIGSLTGSGANEGSALVFGRRNGSGLSYAESVRIDKNGNVGIGTTNPYTKLEIREDNSALSAGNFMTFTNHGTAATHATDSYPLGGMLFNAYRDIRNPSNVAGIWAERHPFAGGLSSAGDLVFGTGANEGNIAVDGKLPTERMRINQVGNVGIGTNSPNSKLSVVGLPSGTNDSVTSGNLAGAVCITDEGNMYIDTDGACAN